MKSTINAHIMIRTNDIHHTNIHILYSYTSITMEHCRIMTQTYPDLYTVLFLLRAQPVTLPSRPHCIQANNVYTNGGESIIQKHRHQISFYSFISTLFLHYYGSCISFVSMCCVALGLMRISNIVHHSGSTLVKFRDSGARFVSSSIFGCGPHET